MPFAKEFDDVFHYGIEPVVVEFGFRCIRVDKTQFIGEVAERIRSTLDGVKLVVADMTGANANVYYEVGYAQGAKKPVILICRRGSPLEFNVQGMRCLFYENIHELEAMLRSALGSLPQAAPS